MVYQNVVSNCNMCNTTFYPHLSINAVGGIMLYGHCPECNCYNACETSFEEMVNSCQQTEVATGEIDLETYDLAAAIVRSVPH